MAINTLVRRSATSLAPFAGRLLGGQRTFTHHFGGALVAAGNRTRLTSSINSVLAPATSHLSFSASPAVKLLRVIEAEIQSSEESLEECEGVPEGFPFELVDNIGQHTISLNRVYEGESIHVGVEPYNFVAADKDDQASHPPMVVKVIKLNGLCLEFVVTADANGVVIHSLYVKDPDMAADQVRYEGLRFDDLDENLQMEFNNYLETRGINPGMTNYLHKYMVTKADKEYTRVLKNLKKFIEA